MQLGSEEEADSQIEVWLDSLSRRNFIFVLLLAVVTGLLFGIYAHERGWFLEARHVEESE